MVTMVIMMPRVPPVLSRDHTAIAITASVKKDIFIAEDMESTGMERSTVMEAHKENTATVITASASTDMDQLVTDIVTKLVYPHNVRRPDSSFKPSESLNMTLIFDQTHCEKSWSWFLTLFTAPNNFLFYCEFA
jgi:hypothetical protein